MSLARDIAKFACNLSYEELPEKVIVEAKRRVIDSVGCAMGAWLSEPAKISREMAALSGEGCLTSIIGSRNRCTPDMAAFANGVMFRYLDYNDTYLSKEPAHPSDNIAALLAIAETFELPGDALILGIVIAYEVQCRLCDAFSIRKKGWDHVTYGAYSTVAGCGAMLGFTEDQMVHALGISGISGNAMRQTRVGELSMWKGCAFANASKNGVFATLLAKCGMTGPSEIFEGEMGFFNQVSHEKFELPKLGKDDDDSFMILKTYIKKYPAEYHSQSAIDAAEQIVAEHGNTFDVEEIEDITIATFTASYEIIGGEPEKWRPQCRETADHSLPYITCAALVDGTVTMETFDRSRFTDESLLSLVAKTKVVPNAELDKIYPEQGIPNIITVRLKNGKVYEKRVDAPEGHALNPMNNLDIEKKFRLLAGKILSEGQVEEALETLWELDNLQDVREIFASIIV